MRVLRDLGGGTGRGVAGRPTYDGTAQAPGAGGIGSQPSGTASTRPTSAATAPVRIPTTRRSTWIAVLHPPADARHAEDRGRDDEDDRAPGEPEQEERTDQPDHRATLGELPAVRPGGSADGASVVRPSVRSAGRGSRRGQREVGERADARRPLRRKIARAARHRARGRRRLVDRDRVGLGRPDARTSEPVNCSSALMPSRDVPGRVVVVAASASADSSPHAAAPHGPPQAQARSAGRARPRPLAKPSGSLRKTVQTAGLPETRGTLTAAPGPDASDDQRRQFGSRPEQLALVRPAARANCLRVVRDHRSGTPGPDRRPRRRPPACRQSPVLSVRRAPATGCTTVDAASRPRAVADGTTAATSAASIRVLASPDVACRRLRHCTDADHRIVPCGASWSSRSRPPRRCS